MNEQLIESDSEMNIKIGTNPIAWTNDDLPELGGEISLEQCLQETRKAGYSGTEMGGKFPRSPDKLRKVLAGNDLQLVSGWWDGKLHENDVETEFTSVLPHLKLLKELGAKHVIYGESSNGRIGSIWNPISQRPVLTSEEWKPYAAKLTHLSERMADFGVGMAFHHHMGTVIESDEDVDRIMDATGPSVGLAFDTGHCLLSGGDPIALCKRHRNRIVHVHCKDVRTDKLVKARTNDMSFMDAILDGVFTVPGDGGVDFDTILKTLKAIDYSGWLVVEAEQNPEKAPPYHFAKLGYDNLSTIAKTAGFHIGS